MARSSTGGRDIKIRNKNRILRYIFRAQRTTKQQIVEALGVSLPTVLQNIKELTSEGLVREVGVMESTGGRKAIAIAPIGDVRMAVGVDITRNHVGLALVNLTGDIVKFRRTAHPFRRDSTYYAALATLIDAFIAEESLQKDTILGVGFSIPGIVKNERITDSHVLGITDVPCAEFSTSIPYPCAFINDANAAGLAEVHADETRSTFAYLSLNNCVGGAIFVDGSMFMGENCRAGEFGHMRLVPHGRICYCGMDGCADAYCAAPVLSRYTQNDLDAFFHRLRAGDDEMWAHFEQYMDMLAIAVNNLRMAFDCPIVLGGRVGGYMADYLPQMRARVGRLNPFGREKEYLYPCRCRREASALGAALKHVEAFLGESNAPSSQS